MRRPSGLFIAFLVVSFFMFVYLGNQIYMKDKRPPEKKKQEKVEYDPMVLQKKYRNLILGATQNAKKGNYQKAEILLLNGLNMSRGTDEEALFHEELILLYEGLGFYDRALLHVEEILKKPLKFKQRNQFIKVKQRLIQEKREKAVTR